MGFIYILTSPSGKSYVGQTTRPIEERFSEHQKPSRCVAIYRAIKKHGWDNFDKSWYECVDDWDLDYHETWLIRELGTLSPGGYNLTTGGSGGIPSEETKKKISEANTGKKHTEETKKKIRESKIGNILSEETKKKISESHTGEKNHSYGKTGDKCHWYGKNHTEETKKKMSEALSGEKHPMYGREHTEEAKKKISEAHAGKILSQEHKKKISEAQLGEKHHNSKTMYQYDLDENYIRSFGSCREAGRYLNTNSSHISECARGKIKSAGGFKWSYDKR